MTESQLKIALHSVEYYAGKDVSEPLAAHIKECEKISVDAETRCAIAESKLFVAREALIRVSTFCLISPPPPRPSF